MGCNVPSSTFLDHFFLSYQCIEKVNTYILKPGKCFGGTFSLQKNTFKLLTKFRKVVCESNMKPILSGGELWKIVSTLVGCTPFAENVTKDFHLMCLLYFLTFSCVFAPT